MGKGGLIRLLGTSHRLAEQAKVESLSVESLSKVWNAKRVVVEDAASGTTLAKELRSSVPGIIAIKPEGDKISRMAVASRALAQQAPASRRISCEGLWVKVKRLFC